MKRSLDSSTRGNPRAGKKSSNAWKSTWDFLTRASLFRKVVIALVLVSLLPVFLYGTVSYIRTRDQIQTMVAGQMQSISQSASVQVDNYAKIRASALERIVNDAQFSSLMKDILDSGTQPKSEDATLMVRNYLVTSAIGSGEPIFDQVMILDKDGKELASSDDQWIRQTFGASVPGVNPVIQPLIAKGNSSSLIYNPFPPFENRFALVTVRKFTLASNQSEYTSVAFTSSPLLSQILKQAASFFNGASAYYYFQPNNTFLTSSSDTLLTSLPKNSAILSAILPVINGPRPQQTLNYVSLNNKNVWARVTPISLGLYLILEVPPETIFGLVPLLDTTNLLMLFFSLVLLAVLAYLGATQVVTPLVHLRNVARGLSEGNFKLRAQVNRRDEIGQLAESMNHMALDLATLYSSLEEKVKERTSQLSTASEVAQLATSSTHLEEILEKTAGLVNEHFGYFHTAIYLVDETGSGILLKKASGEIGEVRMRHARRLAFTDPTLASWVAANNQGRTIDDLSLNQEFQLEEILSEARSEIALPIAIGQNIMGVLDVFSVQTKAFNPESAGVLQTLANQIAGALQNTRLLSSAKVNLEETSLLYQVSRRIIEAADEPAISHTILEILPQISHTNAFLTMDGSNLHILGLYDTRTNKFERNLHTIDIPVARFHDRLAEGKLIFVEDITRPSDYDNILSFFLRRGCKSAAILPSLKNGKVSKILMLGFRDEEHVDQNTLQPFGNLAEVISSALDKFTVLETLQHRLGELEILANFSKASSSETDLNHLYGVLHEQIAKTFSGGDVGFLIALLDPSNNLIDIPYAYESGELISLESLPLGQGLTSLVILNKTPLLLVKDTERRAIELGARIVGKPARSWMGVPLLVGGDLVGALILQDQLNEERFSETDLNLFITLAPQIATAIRNAQLVDQMQKALHAYDQERQLINTWLEHSPDVVIVKNPYGHYVRASKSISQFFDATSDQIIGKSDFDLMDPKAAAQATEQELDILQDGKSPLDMMEMNSQHGKDLWFMTSKIPINDPSGHPDGLLIIRRDVTAMKLAQEDSQRRAGELLTAAEIARDATSTLNIDELLAKVVNLVSERFGFYHSSIFLLDPLGQFAVLRESTGEAGRQLKEMEHKLAVGSKSIIGQTTVLGEAVIVDDVSSDSTYYPNPLLPDTRAELAIPLKIGSRVLGALDVQSTQSGVFTMEHISILGILADQLAVAVDNAQLFARTQDMLGKHRLLHQITIAASTSNSLGDAMDRVVNGLVIAQVADRASVLLINHNELELVSLYGYDPVNPPPGHVAFGKGLVGAAVVENRAILVQDARHDPRYIRFDENTNSELVLPILFGDEVLGVLNMESNKLAGFDYNDQEIMVALVNNLGAIIANWRLVNQIRRQVERQQFLFNAAGKIRRSIDVQTILQTSVNEIGKAMGVPRARITLAQNEETTPGSAAPENDHSLKPGASPKNGKNGSHPDGEVKR